MSRLPSLGRRGEGWFVIQTALFVVVLATWLHGSAWSGIPRVVTSVAGIAALAAGVLLVASGGKALGAALTPLPYPRPDAALVTEGVYARVRHPIYGGVVLVAIGAGLLTASLTALGAAVVLWAFFELKSRREEAWLLARYPEYEAYRTRTRRFIPSLG